jgi:dihydrofolate reductase
MAMMTMTAVVAMAENRVIGDGKGLVWHIPNDLKRVKMLTMGCPLIMGRKTWDSIGRPLPGRASIVMTRDGSWTADGAIAAPNIEAAIVAARNWIENTAKSRSEIILFGGGEIYEQGLEYCHRVERTVVVKMPNGGAEVAYFPKLPAADWDIEIEAEFAATSDSPAYRYERAVRCGATQPF